MANVIKTVLTYQLDGSNRDFNIPFEYLARKFVVVTLIGVDRKVLTLNTDYRFATRTTISLTKAWGPADGYTTIELRRVTSTTDRLVDFTDGSILRAYDLNVAQIQTMHVAEEAHDLTADTIGVNDDGHLDARGRRIVNLANAVDDRDAVPFGQLKTMNQNSWQARNEALQFRNEAEGFRNEAEQFKNTSGQYTEALRQQLSSKLGSLMVGFSRVDDVPRTVGDKLKDVPTANDYMLPSETNLTLAINRAAADGVKSLFVTSDRSYNISSIMELPDDFELLGYGRPSVVCADIAHIIRMNSRTVVSGLKFTGLSPAVLSPHNGAVDVCISGNFFTGQNQIVLLLTCSNVTVANNVFDGTGYGIIQQAGYASNNVRVVSNNARNMKGDFVEANSASIGTRSWQILSNIYEGADNWNSLATERRFVGITELEDVTISNNLIRRTAGDSAIHLEDLLGRTTISDNFFVDSFAGEGCVYNLSSNDDMLVHGNWFVMTDAYTGVNTTAIRTDSNFYSHRCKISSNIFFDATSTGKKLRPAFLAYGGTFDYEDNLCVNTFDIARFASIDTPRFSRNRGVGQLQRGIWADVGSSGTSGSGVIYDGNIIPSLVETDYGIRATTNSNGTGGPKRHAAYNNHIGGDIRIEDPNGNPGQTAENAAWGNRVTGEIVVSNQITADSFGNYSVTAI